MSVLQGVVIAAVAFVLTTGATSLKRRADDNDRMEFNRLATMRRSGDHLVLLYVGSARCVWCKNPALPGYLAIIRDSLAAAAARSGFQFSTVGVAVDVLKGEGLEHLAHVANFDQVASGGSWLNEIFSDVIWSTYGAPSATPQILVVTRTVSRHADVDAVTYTVDREQLVARKSGLRAIQAWVEEGAPLTRPLIASRVPTAASKSPLIKEQIP